MKLNESRMPSYGGQALIEGVLMRGKISVAAAFRNPEGKIEIRTENLQGIYKNKIFQMPFLRGLVILWDSLILGMKYLTLSANIQAKDEKEKLDGSALFLSVFIAIIFALVLFFVLPVVIMQIMNGFFHLGAPWNSLIEGILRLIIMVLYLWSISRMEEIRRVFAYHGAEHKTINAYEDHCDLDVKSVMKYPTQHPRCGTSFLLTLIILSVFVFIIIGELPFVYKILSRIILIPFLAMLSYEFIRWLGKHQDNRFVQLLAKPNLALQNLTTCEPTPAMVEVAIRAFNTMLTMENKS